MRSGAVALDRRLCDPDVARGLPVSASVLGERLDGPNDVVRMSAAVAYNSMDLLQGRPHLVGRRDRDVGSARLLGYPKAYPKLPYASVLFGTIPEETRARAADIGRAGFCAAKFGWAPFGESLASDVRHIEAAREGLGRDGILLIDAGQIFGEDVEAAALGLDAMERNRVTFFEEPFHGSAYDAYRALGARMRTVRTAGREAAHNRFMAEHLMEYGRVGYIQIDCGRIGGLGPAKQVAYQAAKRGVTYVNHTFTSNLALSASPQPYAGLADHRICEYPTKLQPLARDLTLNHIAPDLNGEIVLPDAPGLGIEIDPEALTRFKVDLEIRVKGKTIFSTPSI